MRAGWLAALYVMAGAEWSPGQIIGRATGQEGADIGAVALFSEMWTADEDDVAARLARLGFRNTASRRDQGGLRAMPVWGTLFGFRPVEGLAQFQNHRLSEIVFLMYSRGDVGEISPDEFEDMVRQLRQQMDAWAGGAGYSQKSEGRPPMMQERRVWIKDGLRADLEWSFTGPRREDGGERPFRSEYIRIRLEPYRLVDSARLLTGSGGGGANQVLNSVDLRRRVSRKSDGAVVITGVPMVDQGSKGYCVAATVQRAMEYYGRAFDQHQLAQAADSSAETGTSTEAMVDALRRLGRSLDVRISELSGEKGMIVRSDPGHPFRWRIPKDMARTLKDYNRLAKKKGQPEISESAIFTPAGIMGIYQDMDWGLLKESRNERASERDQFFRDIQRHVDAGVPLEWSLMVGVVPEPRRPVGIDGIGGHMRMIIGYNLKSREIIFSDSWGPGHEAKVMKLEDAWVGTTGLFAVIPRDIRI